MEVGGEDAGGWEGHFFCQTFDGRVGLQTLLDDDGAVSCRWVNGAGDIRRVWTFDMVTFWFDA